MNSTSKPQPVFSPSRQMWSSKNHWSSVSCIHRWKMHRQACRYMRNWSTRLKCSDDFIFPCETLPHFHSFHPLIILLWKWAANKENFVVVAELHLKKSKRSHKPPEISSRVAMKKDTGCAITAKRNSSVSPIRLFWSSENTLNHSMKQAPDQLVLSSLKTPLLLLDCVKIAMKWQIWLRVYRS